MGFRCLESEAKAEVTNQSQRAGASAAKVYPSASAPDFNSLDRNRWIHKPKMEF